MKYGKTIKLFLLDGEANGRISCELSNWTGKAYKIPRIKIKDCGDRMDLNGTGVYLLFSKHEDQTEQVYIGEAESVLKRLIQQLSNKVFWNEAIVFISKDDNLNKAHIKYLENRLHQIAGKAGRYKIENSLIPTQSAISESDKAEMEEYLDNIKLLVNTLGHKVFDEKRESIENNDEVLFSIKAARGAYAKGAPTSEGFIVYKGSKATLTTVSSISVPFLNLRKKLLDNGILKPNGEELLFTEDYIFGSPSTAAVTVMGRNANGQLEWKLLDGTTLRDYESKNT